MHHSPLLLSSLFLAFTLGCPAGDPAKDGEPSKDTGPTDVCDFPVDWHPDSDSDGFGDADTEAQQGCDAPEPGWVSNGDDCDDTLAGVNPDALEICDGIDNNCDQVTDDPADLGTFYADGDGDTYGDVNVTVEACLDTVPSGYVADNTDCDDTLADVNPGALETLCNDVDEDCDGTASNDTDWYIDSDGDGFGDASTTPESSCTPISGRSNIDTDCDDTDSSINPGAAELCDGIDSNCDGSEATNQVELDDLTNSTYNVDVSAAWTSGTAASPASINLGDQQHVRVCPGTYYVAVASVDIVNSITGVTGNAAEVVLDGGGALTVLSVSDGNISPGVAGFLEVNDLTVTNGSGTEGGNIYCRGSTYYYNSFIVLNNVVVSDGVTTGQGGGLYGDWCHATITDSTFSNNTSSRDGGAISTNEFIISNTLFSGNHAGRWGGAIYTTGPADLFTPDSTLTDTWFVSNTADSSGGAIKLSAWGQDTVVEMSCTSPGSGGFHGNQSSTNGGMLTLDATDDEQFAMPGYARFAVTPGAPCDFGEPGTANDNTPEDVWLGSFFSPSEFNVGDGRTFRCSMSDYYDEYPTASCISTDGL